MAKYAELFEGARVVFNKENRDGFNLRDAIATVVDMSPRLIPDGCVVVQLDEAITSDCAFALSDYDHKTRRFISHARYLTPLPSCTMSEITTLEVFL